MPQIEGGPKGLNSILESAYAAARSGGHDKGTASAIAWTAAKAKYRKKGGKWVEKLYRDLSDIAFAVQSEILKSPKAHDIASKMEHLVAALSKMSEFVVEDGRISKIDEDGGLEWLGVDDVEENPLNREIDRGKVDAIKSSIQDTGSVKPLVYVEIDKDGEKSRMVTDGHHRLVALKELGYAEFPARVSDERGTDTTKDDQPVKLVKEIGSADVSGLELVRQDLQGGKRRRKSLVKIGWTDEARAAALAARRGEASPELHSSEPHGSYFTQVGEDGTVTTSYKPVGAEKFTTISAKGSMDEAEQHIANHKHSIFAGEGGMGGGNYYGRSLPGPRPSRTGLPKPFGSVGHQGGHAGGPGVLSHLGHAGHEAHRLHSTVHRGGGRILGGHGRHGGAEQHHKPDTESEAGKQIGAKKFADVTVDFKKGGPGSGSWDGPGQPRFPHAGNKDFAEPFHSGNHVKQFLASNNLVIGSVDRGDLSPEKNELRRQEFEQYLQDKKIPYKKGMGHSKEWGSEASYIIHAPSAEDSNDIEDQLYNKYKQDAVIRVRNAHAILQPKSMSAGVKHANVNSGIESGDHIDDNYTLVDGQKFRINFK